MSVCFPYVSTAGRLRGGGVRSGYVKEANNDESKYFRIFEENFKIFPLPPNTQTGIFHFMFVVSVRRSVTQIH